LLSLKFPKSVKKFSSFSAGFDTSLYLHIHQKILVYLYNERRDIKFTMDDFDYNFLNNIDKTYVIVDDSTTYEEKKHYIVLSKQKNIPSSLYDKMLHMEFKCNDDELDECIKSFNEKIKYLKNITIFGYRKNIGDNWIFHCPSLIEVKFSGFSALESIGKNWLSYCDKLESINFNGLSALTTVGDGWMASCNALRSPNFNGLDALTTVSHNWMSSCKKLESPKFEGLTNLHKVGDFWMYACSALKNPDFEGLSSLEEIGGDWMTGSALVNPNFKGLSSLQKVGESWMSSCSSLTTPDFSSLTALKKVGNNWMDKCPNLSLETQRYRSNFMSVNSDGKRKRSKKKIILIRKNRYI